MKWNYPGDADAEETYEEYIARKKREQAGTDLMMTIFGLAFRILRILVIYGVFIYVSYVLTKELFSEETDKWKLAAFTVLFTYLILCIVFFIKGIAMGLRWKGKGIWVLPWIICIMVTCAFPALFTKFLVEDMFHPKERGTTWSRVISWGAAILLGLYVYNAYKFHIPAAPKFLFWSYALGRRLVGR